MGTINNNLTNYNLDAVLCYINPFNPPDARRFKKGQMGTEKNNLTNYNLDSNIREHYRSSTRLIRT